METGLFNCLLPSASCLLFRRGMTVIRSAIPFARGFAACALVVLAAGLAHAQDAPVSIDKVEPPSWWAGHTVNPVRLLLRGSNLKGAEVLPPRGGPFKVTGVRSGE